MRRIRKLFLLLFCLGCAGPLAAADTVSLQPYVREISVNGLTAPLTTATISSEVAGKIETLEVDVGDALTTAAVVARLDTTFVSLELEKNNLMQQQVNHRLTLEKKTLARLSSLITQNSTAQATYDEAEVKAKVLEVELKNLKNEKAALQERLERHTVYGEKGWLVMERFVEGGEYVQPGTPLVLLGDFSSLIVRLQLSIEEIQLLRQTTPLRVVLPEPGVTLSAAILRISPAVDRQTRKARVDLQLAEPDKLATEWHRSGLMATVEISGKEDEHLFTVPVEAIFSRYDAHWLISAENELIRVVRVGMTDQGGRAIIAGQDLSATMHFLADPAVHMESLRHPGEK